MGKPAGWYAYDSFQRHYARYMGHTGQEAELVLSYLPFEHLRQEIQELWGKVEADITREFRQK